MPKVEVDENEDDLRDVKLMLPSDFSPAERSRHSIEDFADIERRLREGEAYDVLELLRQQLNRNNVLQVDRQENSRGTRENTRSYRVLVEAKRLKDHWVSEYKRVRCAMISLGLDTNDTTTPFKPLREEDLWRNSTHVPHQLSTGYKRDGWIWRVGQGLDSIGNKLTAGM